MNIIIYFFAVPSKMPRNKKRKTDRQIIPSSVMKNAVSLAATFSDILFRTRETTFLH